MLLLSSPLPSHCLSSSDTLHFSLCDTVEVTGPVLPLSLISGSLCEGVLAHLLFLAPITLIKTVLFFFPPHPPPSSIWLSVDINGRNIASHSRVPPLCSEITQSFVF